MKDLMVRVKKQMMYRIAGLYNYCDGLPSDAALLRHMIESIR